MPSEYFNPPPNWPVPAGWTPPPDWHPDPSWPPAPPGWQFWTSEPPQRYQQPWAPAPRPNRRRIGVIAAAAGLAIALTAGAVGVVTWWNRSRGEAPLPDRMLAATFPTDPNDGESWTVKADDLDSGSGAQLSIATPELSLGPTAGAIVAGDRVIVKPWSVSDSSSTGRSLTALDLSDGSVAWTLPFDSDTTPICAPHPLGDTLPCMRRPTGQNRSELQFIELASGKVSSTATLPFHASMIDSDGEYVYTAGYDPQADAFMVAKGSADDPAGEWKTTIDEGQCADHLLGDAWEFQIGHGLVWGFSGGGAAAVLRASDGSPVLDHDVAEAWVTEGPRIVSRRCQAGVNHKQWKTEVADGSGTVLFSTSDRLQQMALQVYSGDPPPLFTQAGEALDRTTGERLWRADVTDRLSHWPMLVGHVVMWADGKGLVAYDVGSGQQLWSEPTVLTDYGLSTFGALTDGQRVFLPTDDAGIYAIDVADGSRAWSERRIFDAREPTLLYATTDGMVAVTRSDVRLLRPTGPPAVLPSTSGADEASENGGGTELVTKCGRPPQFEPEAIRADSGALVITVRIVAKCPGGDVLSGRQTRIAVTSGGQNVASAVFDLSSDPIVIAPGSGSSSDEPSVTHEFRFPVGTFWRIPVSLDEVPGGGSTQKGAVDLDATKLVIDCEEEGSTTDTGTVGTGSVTKSSTATEPAEPKTGDNESSSFDALRAIANADRPFVTRNLENRWVPQLSSKRPGLFADGIVWNNAETLREHLELRLKYPEVRLLWSGEWSTFSERDFWVTIAGVTFPDAQGALAWCRSHGLDRDHCYAKLVSTTHPIEGSTAYNK